MDSVTDDSCNLHSDWIFKGVCVCGGVHSDHVWIQSSTERRRVDVFRSHGVEVSCRVPVHTEPVFGHRWRHTIVCEPR